MIKKLLYISIVAILAITFGIYIAMKDVEKHQKEISSKTIEEIPLAYKEMAFEVQKEGQTLFKEIVYDNMTMEELTAKLNKSLNSTLTNKGEIFAKVAIANDVDPYLVTAIALYETGCKWNCSSLVKNCNNVGGVKGSPSCNGGAYRSYNTLDEGITKFIENIKNNYYNYGLTDAYSMQRKYTGGSTSWATKVNSYIKAIKSA